MTLDASHATVRRGGRAILDDVDVEARPGEVLAVVGPNGAGKSTLLGVLSGGIRPSNGATRLDGRLLGDWGAAALARRRAVVAQSVHAVFPFRVHEVVAMGRAPHAGRGARRDAEIVDAALEAFDLLALADRAVTSLSGGERQRAHLARALAQVWEASNDGPCWLLLDEPIAFLDPTHQLAALEAARSFARRGGGVVAVLHDLRLAQAYADRVAVLADGRLQAVARPPEALAPSRVATLFGMTVAQAMLFVGDDRALKGADSWPGWTGPPNFRCGRSSRA